MKKQGPAAPATTSAFKSLDACSVSPGQANFGCISPFGMDVKLGLSQIVGFENMVLRRMTGTERYEVTGGWRETAL
jgi:hypothetical protein